MSNSLLFSRRFLPLFLTQGLGAVNDNLFKNALVVLALYRLAHIGPVLVALAGGIFVLPYALFSSVAGQLADAREKSRLIVLTKFWELFLALLASAGFLTGSFPVLMAVLFGLGVQATFFSPLKYGILPDHLREDELVLGNGLIEAGTFVCILAGTVAGGALIALAGGVWVVSAGLVIVAVAGVATAFAIPVAPAADAGLRVRWNLARETVTLVREAKREPAVWFAVLAISWFWAVGATVLAEMPTIAHDALRADAHVVTVMLGVFAVGVGAGSLAAAKLMRAPNLKMVALAGFGVSACTGDFAFTATHAGHLASVAAVFSARQGWHLLLDLLALSVFGGIYSVPLYVLLQERAEASHRARMIAANNVVNAVAGVAAAGMTAGLYAAGLPAAGTLLLIAIGNVGVSVWVMRRAGDIGIRQQP